jgi:hypothetical protein
MQAPGTKPFRTLNHDVYSLDGGGIKETTARPCLRDRARTCEISDAHTQPIQRVTSLYKFYQGHEMSSLSHHEWSREHRLPARLKLHWDFKIHTCGSNDSSLGWIISLFTGIQSSGAQPLQIHSHDVGPLNGEELNKLMPDLVSEIEQERVKYLTLINSQLHKQLHNQFSEWLLIWTVLVCTIYYQKIGKVTGYRYLSIDFDFNAGSAI